MWHIEPLFLWSQGRWTCFGRVRAALYCPEAHWSHRCLIVGSYIVLVLFSRWFGYGVILAYFSRQLTTNPIQAFCRHPHDRLIFCKSCLFEWLSLGLWHTVKRATLTFHLLLDIRISPDSCKVEVLTSQDLMLVSEPKHRGSIKEAKVFRSWWQHLRVSQGVESLNRLLKSRIKKNVFAGWFCCWFH